VNLLGFILVDPVLGMQQLARLDSSEAAAFCVQPHSGFAKITWPAHAPSQQARTRYYDLLTGQIWKLRSIYLARIFFIFSYISQTSSNKEMRKRSNI